MASRVTVLWVPPAAAPAEAPRYEAAIAADLPRGQIVVRLERNRRGAWRVTHARPGADWRALNRPAVDEFRTRVNGALVRAGLWMSDCPVCGQAFAQRAAYPREFELRQHVAMAHSHSTHYWHAGGQGCSPAEFWARFTLPCGCGGTYRLELRAHPDVEAGGQVACDGCSSRLELEAMLSGSGLQLAPAS